MDNKTKKNLNKLVSEYQKFQGYTQEEVSLISNTFLDRDDLLMAIRKFFLQGELTVADDTLINGLTENTISVIKKAFLPEIDLNAPLDMLVDLWGTIDPNATIDDSYATIEALKLRITYLEEQFDRLNGKKPKIMFNSLVPNDKKIKEGNFIELKARNEIMRHIERQLRRLGAIAISNAEISDEDKQKKILMDSNQ